MHASIGNILSAITGRDFVGLVVYAWWFHLRLFLHLTFRSLCYNHKIYRTVPIACTDKSMIPVSHAERN
jgi:hypothetical protein